MTVTVTRQLPDDARDTTLDRVHAVLADDPALSGRPLAWLHRAHAQQRIMFAHIDGELAGWVIAIDHRPEIRELAGLYVMPGHRGKALFAAMIRGVLDSAPHTVCVTRDRRLAGLLTRRFGFRRCGIWRLVALTRGRLLRDRLHPVRWRSMARMRVGFGAGRRYGLSFLERPMTVLCPACTRQRPCVSMLAEDRAFGSRERAMVARCRACGHVWQPQGELCAKAFAEPALPFVIRVMEHPVVARAVYRRRIAWLARHVPLGTHSRALDVGCGTGAFSRALHDATGAVCVGIDIDAALVRGTPRPGVTLRVADFATMDPAERYDLVTMFHVLEHLADPVATIGRALRSLRPGGTLCIETPVADGLAARLFGRFWFPLLPPFHRHIPSRMSLRRLIGAADGGVRWLRVESVYLPGEYAVSVNLPFERLLPHPHQRRQLNLPRRLTGALLATSLVALTLPLEVLSAAVHRLLPISGHVRVLLRKAD